MKLEDKLYLVCLYDIYYETLTKRQQEIFEMYHDEDYSITEISNQLEITTAAVSKTIKKINEHLYSIEDMLKINSNYDFNIKVLKDNNLDIDIINKIKR